jgi:hypothetical protein
MRNSKVILAQNINLDNSYSNVLNYTEEQMLALLRDEENLVYENDTYSFIRENENQINIKASYQTCLSANYLAFQNTNYGGKWFFAFITDVKYNSDSSTIVSFEVDIFSTWFNNLTIKPCFVEREHVNNDTAGLHTVPENLETGEYIKERDSFTYEQGTAKIIFQVITQPTGDPSAGDYSGPTNLYGGVFSGTEFRIMTAEDGGRFIRYMDEIGRKDYIVNIFMYYGNVEDDGHTYFIHSQGSVVCYFKLVKTTQNATTEVAVTVRDSKPSTIGSYTPKNKKLLTYPYCYMLANNNGGTTKVYHYEDFSSNSIQFTRKSVVSVGGSVMYFPWNYKMDSANNDKMNFSEGFVGAKFPTCSWTSDGYINWLTQTAINREDSYKRDIAQTLLGAGATAVGLSTGFLPLALYGGGALAGGVVETIGDIKDNIQEKKQHKIAPMELEGNASAGDVIFAEFNSQPTFDFMHIKEEYAKIIDDYWTRFGYQINLVKTPNITGRRYRNYVKIGSGEDIGNGTIPNKFKDALNRIFRAGTTIWHSHDNIGNFNLTNDIL